MDLAFLIQLYNSALALVVGSDFFASATAGGGVGSLTKSKGIGSIPKRVYIVAWIVPNLLLFLLHWAPSSTPSPLLILRAVLSGTYATRTLTLSVVLTYVVMALRIYILVGVKMQLGSIEAWVAQIAGCIGSIWLILLIGGWHDDLMEHTTPSKVLCVIVTYAAVCWWDIRRRRETLRPLEFSLHFTRASVETMFVMPFVAVLVAMVFLIVVPIFQALGVPEEFFNAPIYYGVIYGPWATVYILVKSRCITRTSSSAFAGKEHDAVVYRSELPS
mmetsp:Transcript_3256/g.7619  ORF Transcript_3256/g.7619 Transcript_3256/m.7619 type:complete len:274 (-) Transcript_3256:133-954(-)|eukprot:CAMPEP_0114496906 /NCGR_PEP_ID=MMETSP0109-20121206/6024_1 /TAXON_ID=29199 /ORGANISM="Chlorarachnion reptans, Strain CCCM449" /LENGTH=273 /DNA_ID=CAMNT_0001674219 /DNA_START=103 /DNA_END=924 /DNA_ORIENTATION=-